MTARKGILVSGLRKIALCDPFVDHAATLSCSVILGLDPRMTEKKLRMTEENM